MERIKTKGPSRIRGPGTNLTLVSGLAREAFLWIPLRILGPLTGLATVLSLVSGCETREGALNPGELWGGQEGVLIEELRIDGYESDLVPIGRSGAPRSVAVAEDGIVAIKQDVDGMVRFFDPSGVEVGSVGGKGEGPGEFMRITRLAWMGDTLTAYDPALRRMTLFAPDMTFVRTVPVPTRAEPSLKDSGQIPEFPFVSLLGPAGHGELFVNMGGFAGTQLPARFRDRLIVGRIDGDGTITAILAMVPIPPQITLPRGGVASNPFPNPVHTGISPRGDPIAFARASLEGGKAGTFYLHVVDRFGDTVFSRRYPFHSVPLPQETADSVIRRQISSLPGDLAGAYRRQARAPSVYPPIEGIVVGHSGRVWVREILMGGRHPYLVVDANGDPLGTVELDANQWLGVADGDHIWVVEEDENGVESVLRYRVSWVEGSTAERQATESNVR